MGSGWRRLAVATGVVLVAGCATPSTGERPAAVAESSNPAVSADKESSSMGKPANRARAPLVCLWQHQMEVDITDLVSGLGFNAVWTSDEPYHGQAWEETHMYRSLQVPGIDYVFAKIERLQWGQTHEGSVKHAKWIGELSLEHGEIVGLYLNDFYDEVEEGYRTMEQWREIIAAAKAANPNLPIWVPHYPHRGNEERDYDIDYQGVIFNVWDPQNITAADRYLTQAEGQHAGKTLLGGLYLSSGPRRGHWLTEEDFKGLLRLYVDHINAGKLDGLRIFSAGQLDRRPEYVVWAKEVLKELKAPM